MIPGGMELVRRGGRRGGDSDIVEELLEEGKEIIEMRVDEGRDPVPAQDGEGAASAEG